MESRIAGIPIALQPFDIVNDVQHLGYLSFLESQTDEAGHFSIANIVPVSVQLVVLPHDAPDYEILSVRIGLVTIYQDRMSFSDGIAFSIKPGTHIENVEVIAKPRMRIRGRAVFADGTPLANASVKIKARTLGRDIIVLLTGWVAAAQVPPQGRTMQVTLWNMCIRLGSTW